MKHLFTLICFLLIGFQVNAQNCSDPLACNIFVNYSLDTNGEGIITPDVILEGNYDPTCDYEIALMSGTAVLISGTNILDIDCSYVGEFTLSIANDGGSCWGTISIEDILNVCSTDVGAGNLPLKLQPGNSWTTISNVDMNGNPLTQVLNWLYAIPEADILSGENLIEFPESSGTSQLAGVSTLDLVLMQKMFNEGIEYPLRAVLSDVDGSDYFGVSDLVTTRELILGIINELPAKNHLYFPDNYKFASSFDPFDDIPNFQEFKFNQDTLGDVSFTFSTYALADINGVMDVDSFATQTIDDRNFMQSLLIEDQAVQAGQIVSVPLSFKNNDQSFIGLQMALQLDGATLIDLSHDYTGLELMTNLTNDDDLRFSILESDGDNQIELTLNLEVLKDGMLSDIISLNGDFNQEIANFEESGTVYLEFSPSTGIEDVFLEQFKINPNPMTSTTLVQLPTEENVYVDILNMQGQLILKTDTQNGQIELSRTQFPSAGMYFIQTTLNQKTISKKLIVL